MKSRELLFRVARKIAAHTDTPVKPRSGTNAPPPPQQPTQPDTNAKGKITPAMGNPKAGKNKKKAGIVNKFLEKTAAQFKAAAPRPGRLDGDIALTKLASRHKSAKKSAK
jgi:hypothetical protein